jgi:hydroxyethylthiazole kinase-like uncharacterized protein yjeF
MEIKSALFTYAGCAEADRAAIGAGLSAKQLMGTAAALTASRLLDLKPEHIHILCGKGNNGGDGWALAWMLLGVVVNARNITLYAVDEPRSDEARLYASLVKPFLTARPFEDMDAGRNHVIAEALLGSGQKEAPAGSARTALDAILRAKDRGAFLVSLDVPAGLVEESPCNWQNLPLPDLVHSYGAGKLAAALDANLAGRVQVLPIGFPPLPAGRSITSSDAAPFSESVFLCNPRAANLSVLLKRPLDHKYSAGSATIVAGEEGMEGAAVLAARSFFAAGGGIAEVCTFSENARRTILAADPALMAGLVGSPGLQPRGHALLIGPGIRLNEEKASLILGLLGRTVPGTRVILDASCAELARDARYPALLRQSTLLTPHHGEWKKLGGTVPDCVRGFGEAAAHARSLGVQALIKGPVSVLIRAESSLVLPAPQPGLATAGSGDCLGGVLLAALARGLDLETAVAASLGLLHRAAASKAHPEASEFPDLMRAVLSGIA